MTALSTSATGSPKSSRQSQALLFLTMFVSMTGFGVIMPILPYYAENMGATATHLGLLTGMYAGMQFLFAPVWGRISDRWGRKPVMLLGLFGFALTFAGFGLSTELWMMFVSRAISGLITSATMPTVMAYIADTTDHQSRGSGMSLLGSAMGLGAIFGPVIGGFMSEYGPSTPFFFSAALSLAVAVFAWIFLPESLSGQARAAAKMQTGQQSPFLDVFRLLGTPVGFMLILALLTSFGISQMEGSSALFYKARIDAGGKEMGVIFMVMGAVSFLTQFLLVGRAINKLGEQKTFLLSLLGVALAFLLYQFISSLATAIPVVIVMGFCSSFFSPALNTMVSNRTADTEQGRTMGVMNSYYSLGRMIGPICGGIIFDHLGIQMPFYFASVIMLISIGMAVRFFSRSTAPALAEAPDSAAE
jgi:DHA1 family multidrug resistance protein-like MFS transporter